MTINEMQTAIIEELTIELQNETDFSVDLLTAKVKSAIRECKTIRDYPSFYTNAQIEKDVVKFYSQIKDISMYDYCKIGAEGQESYNADGESIYFDDRNKLWYGVRPIARV